MDTRNANRFFLVAVLLTAIMAASVFSVPSGPSITYAGQSTSASASVPTVEGSATITGGVIATVLLSAKEANDNWKAYVGNVSGVLVLEDSANYSIYEWAMTTPTGEVYATRTASAINWSSLACANTANVNEEETEMSHTPTYAPTDSINLTFSAEARDHWGFAAGGSTISSNSCNYSINPWVNDSSQTADIFEEVLLYDGSNILYTSRIQDNLVGYRNDTTRYDFQMLVAENASPSASRTNYYFYVELV